MKLVVGEPGSGEARTRAGHLLRGGEELCTVDLALAETLNAIWKHVRIHHDLTPGDARSAVKDLVLLCGSLKVLSTSDLSQDAVELALEENLSAYDSLYIAGAKTIGATLWTADGKLYEVARRIVPSGLLVVRPRKA